MLPLYSTSRLCGQTMSAFCIAPTSPTATVNCWECPHYLPNREQQTVVYANTATTKKKDRRSTAQRNRDALKQLPGNRKAMRF